MRVSALKPVAVNVEKYPLGLSRMQWVMRSEIVHVLREHKSTTVAGLVLGVHRATLTRWKRHMKIKNEEWKNN